jgi:hypothetical protein
MLAPKVSFWEENKVYLDVKSIIYILKAIYESLIEPPR